MKHIFLALLTAVACSALHAQKCSGYYYLNAGEVEMTNYDGRGKESGKVVYKISDVKTSGGTTSASFETIVTDKRGRQHSQGKGVYKCNGSTLFVDARIAMNDQNEAYKDMDVKMTEAFIEYPGQFSEGLLLKDANFKMSIFDKKGDLFSTVTYDMTNRKVKGQETITTAAGTWECWKIGYDCKIRSEVAGIGIPITFRVTEWFAPGVGVIKSESSKGAKTVGSSLITAIRK